MTFVTDTDLARILGITISPDTLPHSDLLPGQESSDILDLDHTQI